MSFFSDNDPIFPDPDQARELLVEELSKSQYTGHWDPLTSLISWFKELYDAITFTGETELSLQAVLLGGFLIALVIIGGIVMYNPIRLGGRRSHAVLDDEDISLTEVWTRLQMALSEQHWDDAIVWTFRAQALVLHERDVVTVSPGLTSQEVARAASTVYPHMASQWDQCAQIFDSVRYGDAAATKQDYEVLAHVLQTLDVGRRL